MTKASIIKEAKLGQNDEVDGSRFRRTAIRVMIVDDSLVARTVLCKMVEKAEGLSLSATANNAEEAIKKLSEICVDVILLDLEMPGMGGLAALPKILTCAGGAQVVVVSSLTAEGTEATMHALSLGATDTILKPRPGEFTSDFRTELTNRIRTIGISSSEIHNARFDVGGEMPKKGAGIVKRPRAIAIGASTGGVHSMCQMLRHLPKDVDQPILITQHLPHSFMPVFARQIEMASSRKAIVAEDGMPVIAGEILIAPGDGHLIIKECDGLPVTGISRNKVANGCCPSVDPMLESMTESFDGAILGIILSGMGRDGVIGARCLVEAGGTILAQDPETSAVWGMPRAVAEAGLASAILSPEGLAARISQAKGVPTWK